ncbi:hypothetical protein SteCoe_28823 [Stentor coeruleus]|uniref:Uncharacterized protein n=1 Tax=Stentor coeruleus TaxID=5963 RepID=A0A1R2B7D3_9CILI|nr:hypothetical protein SteCoe_28823 [Stentor coeruleus]
MVENNEVNDWVQGLQEELVELENYQEKIQCDNEIESVLKYKLNKAANLLRTSIEKLIENLKNLLDRPVDYENTKKILGKDYLRILKNVENFYSTFHPSKLVPSYVRSTFASRKRALSSKEYTSQQQTMQNFYSPERLQSSRIYPPKSPEPNISRQAKNIEKNLKDHKHKQYEERIQELENENFELRKKVMYLTEETEENHITISELQKKIRSMEGCDLEEARNSNRFTMKRFGLNSK